MQAMVLGVLSRGEVSHLQFAIPTVNIEPGSYATVASKIRSGDITVQFDSSMGASGGKYRHTHDVLFLGFRALGGSTDREALIIHECTHAACDIANRSILVSYSEAAAFTAQCLYFYYRHEDQFRGGANPTFTNAVLREAWNTAALVRGGRASLSADDLGPLLAALANDGRYREAIAESRSVDYTGV